MKEARIHVRISEETKAALERVEKTTGLDQATLIRKCAEALIEYVEEHGEITFPLTVQPKKKKGSFYPPHREQNIVVEEGKPKKSNDKAA